MSWHKGSTYGFDSDPPEDRWREQAACIDEDPELWFPVSSLPRASREAKRICRGCPVRVECLAAGGREADGIWGGQTPKERKPEIVARPADLVCETCGDVYRPSLPGIRRCPPCRIGGLKPCGTVAAYYRHVARKEPACDPCMAAKRRKSATDRASRARRRAVRRAS